jgi:small nuclear ribonucleoprotein (snRNP)-like protein
MSALQELIGQPLRVTVEDRRVIGGILYCVDSDLNLVLADAIEIRPPVKESQRASPPSLSEFEPDLEAKPIALGSVMVPSKLLVKVESLVK